VKRFVLGAATLMFVAAAVALGVTRTDRAPGALPLKHYACGDNVTQSSRLAEDVGPNCPAYGLAITADGVTLDLNGHTVDGDDGADYGITASGKSHITIKNGTITDFFGGVTIQGGSNETIKRIRATSNTQYGIQLVASRSTVSRNFVFSNPIGIYSTGNFDRILSNTAQSNTDGIEISSGHSNLIEGNRAVSNSATGIFEGFNTPRFGNTVTQNVADSNDTGGIKVFGDFAHVSKNTADHNTGLGIDAVADTIDDGGNRASGNSAAHQCENVACS
jgi:parallel beta-helix repeat protein